jgi:hypothetical protein
MQINELPVELQNKIFYYYAEHPCSAMIKSFMICEVCDKGKNRFHKCDYCKRLFCTFCEAYEKIGYRQKNPELVCEDCLYGHTGLFDHFRKLYFNRKTYFQYGVFQEILASMDGA